MLKQQLQIKLSQKLSPQQIQLMKMIQLSTLELEQKIESEMGENPALESGIEKPSNDPLDNDYEENEKIETDEIEIDQYLSDDEIPSYKLYANNYSSDDDTSTIPVTGGISLHQHLSQQIGNLILSETEMEIAEFIIGSIDESGYLRRSNEELIDDLAFTQNLMVTESQIEKTIKAVQSLDPAGIAARSLKECLQLQLEKKKKDRSRRDEEEELPLVVLPSELVFGSDGFVKKSTEDEGNDVNKDEAMKMIAIERRKAKENSKRDVQSTAKKTKNNRKLLGL